MYKAQLERVALEAAENVYTEDGKASMTLAQRKLEGLGVRISQWAEWDGLAIMKVFAAALEDANFHAEAEVVFGWIAREEENDQSTDQITS